MSFANFNDALSNAASKFSFGRAADLAIRPTKFTEGMRPFQPGDYTHDFDGMPFVFRGPDGSAVEAPVDAPRKQFEREDHTR